MTRSEKRKPFKGPAHFKDSLPSGEVQKKEILQKMQ